MQVNMLNKKSGRIPSRKNTNSESGVTILEMVVAMLVLTVGLLGLAASIGYAVTVSNKGRNITNTKLLVVSCLEQMETLRNTQQLTFAQIANVGDPGLGTGNFVGFPTGFQPVSINPGPDGIFGTADDLINAGPDNIYGTADDFTDYTWAVAGLQRQIAITSLSTNLKRIEVTVRYPDPDGHLRDLVGVSYLNNDATTNFL